MILSSLSRQDAKDVKDGGLEQNEEVSDSATMNKHDRHEGGCPARVFEEARVTVPFTVRAFADVDDVDVRCKGKPEIRFNCDETPGEPGKVSRFTVSQRLRVDIPIEFRADADVGEAHVDFDLHDDEDCNGRDDDDDCDDCDDDDDQRSRKGRNGYRYVNRS